MKIWRRMVVVVVLRSFEVPNFDVKGGTIVAGTGLKCILFMPGQRKKNAGPGNGAWYGCDG